MADIQLIGGAVTGSDTSTVYAIPSNAPDCMCEMLLSAPTSSTNVWDMTVLLERSTDEGQSWRTISRNEIGRDIGNSIVYTRSRMELTRIAGNRLRVTYNVGGNSVSLYVTIQIP